MNAKTKSRQNLPRRHRDTEKARRNREPSFTAEARRRSRGVALSLRQRIIHDCPKHTNRGNLRLWLKILSARYAIVRKNGANARSIVRFARALMKSGSAKTAGITARPVAKPATCRHSSEELGKWVIW